MPIKDRRGTQPVNDSNVDSGTVSPLMASNEKNNGNLRTIDNQHDQSFISRLTSGLGELLQQNVANSMSFKKKQRMLRRSHHTMCTVKGETEKIKGGYKIEHYKSYVFGGII